MCGLITQAHPAGHVRYKPRQFYTLLTHWGLVTQICISKRTIIGTDNGLSPSLRQAIIWTNAGILLIWTLGTNFIEISSEIHAFSFKKMHLKKSSAKWRPFCLGLNVLTSCCTLLRFEAGAFAPYNSELLQSIGLIICWWWSIFKKGFNPNCWYKKNIDIEVSDDYKTSH